ncbi:hypothetical protein GE09DRAFT_1228224 [Coniochaeta sp. 2T2.1]|nr:hypothetical protein GE09DRAFT_1228224 [Coniochaeta sp. 2T2.1]
MTRGNDLYKQGNLGQAETAYMLAASLAPDDPTPLSNFSLELAKDVPGDDEATERERKALNTRLAKCYVHGRQFDNAREAIKQVPDWS